MELPIELFKDENGALSEFLNPVIKQECYYLEISKPNETETINSRFKLKYINLKKNKELHPFEVFDYLKACRLYR